MLTTRIQVTATWVPHRWVPQKIRVSFCVDLNCIQNGLAKYHDKVICQEMLLTSQGNETIPLFNGQVCVGKDVRKYLETHSLKDHDWINLFYL